MGVGVGEMIRGVPGVWYCCDMARRVGKEGKGGSTRLEAKEEKKLFGKEGWNAKSEWSGRSGCLRLAIVPVFLLHCRRACCVETFDMSRKCAEMI